MIVRLFHIYWVCARYRIDRLFFPSYACLSWYWDCLTFFRFASVLNLSRGERLCLMLEDLGPIFVKFGQILSMRADLLPMDVVESLDRLQDKVEPFPGEQAVQKIEKSLKKNIAELFASFTKKPFASASMAQVHEAILNNDERTMVVVKVLRPKIHQHIKRDVRFLYRLASFLEFFYTDLKRVHLKQVVSEFEHTLSNETDMIQEGANASLLRKNFADDSMVYIPKIYFEYTSEEVLVMEKVQGIKVDDVSKLQKMNVNLKKLAENGVHLFFTQVFRDRFFHADIHPGNFFLDLSDVNNPKYLLVDFGIVGSLSLKDQRYLAENLLAFFNQDYQKVAQLHVESGWVPSDIRIDLFESAIRGVCEPIFAKPLKDMSFGLMLIKLFRTAKAYKMENQPQLLLLQKTLLSVEALGKRLYPDLDLWTTAKPYLENWLKEQMGFRSFSKKCIAQMPYWLEKAPELPNMLHKIIEKNAYASSESSNFSDKKAIKKRKKSCVFLSGVILGALLTIMLWQIHSH
jgi:ubiquinone biosynthesis protein